jgi:hypothetical protein
MKLNLGQLRQVIREELTRVTEAAKPTAVIATIQPGDQSKWDEALRAMKLKSMVKFVPSAGGVDVVFQGYGTPGETKRRAEVLGRKLQKVVSKTAATEAPVDDAVVYKLLTMAFTSTVGPDDVKYIRFQPLKNAVRMVDYDGMLGNMDAGVGASDLAHFGITARQLADWLAAHGARPMKPQRRQRPMGPMGGYD